MKIPITYRILGNLRSRIDNYPFSQKLFKKLSTENIFFIQIGANDGVSQDPIFQFNNNWNGLLVEPIPEIFEELKNNYKNKSNGKIFENIAVGDVNGEMTLKIPIDNSSNHHFRHKIASFVENTINEGMEFELIKVEVITLDNLIKKNNVSSIDLVVIDVEGYELSILNSFSFSIKPKIIYMETRFFCFDEMIGFNDRMNKLGYSIFPEKDNCLYILK